MVSKLEMKDMSGWRSRKEQVELKWVCYREVEAPVYIIAWSM